MNPYGDHDGDGGISGVWMPGLEFVKLIAREAGFTAAKEVLGDHKENCPLAATADQVGRNEDEITKLRIGWAKLLGVGSAIAIGGGLVATAVASVFGK